MSGVIDLQGTAQTFSKPYAVTRSTLGATTKVLKDNFICKHENLHMLQEMINEKIAGFQPLKAGFQYLISFSDNTHNENNDLESLSRTVASSGKKTDKLILNWIIVHEIDSIQNEMSITVRISNPVNPFVVL